MSYEHVMSPIQVGPVEVKNRIVRTAHGSGRFSDDYADHLVAYHAARARDGVGLITLESMRFHRTDPHMARAIMVDNPSLLTYYRRLKEATAGTGVAIVQQIDHRGRHIQPESGEPGWSSSPLPGLTEGTFVPGQHVPREMGRAEIDELIEAYVAGARRAREGGLEGVEIKCNYSLITQFLSPALNFRTDRYGGSRENRLRFLQEVLRAVRAEVSGEMLVGVRMPPEDTLEGGLSIEDMHANAVDLDREGLIDYLSLATGDYAAVHQMVGLMDDPHGYQLPRTLPVGRGISAPRILVGRVMNLDEAESIVASGRSEMVAMVRATIADPELMQKTLSGRASEVRPCIGLNEGCVAAPGRRMPFGCAVNVAANHELLHDEALLTRVDNARRVLVVGAGPAGLEAARILALRGHRVTLAEAADEIGGQVQLARRAPHRREIGAIVDWFARELDRLGIDVRLATTVDGAWVREHDPAAVIVATGCRPRDDGRQIAGTSQPIAGFDRDHVVTSRDVLSGARDVAGTVLVFDDIGHYEAVAVAESLRERGSTVHFAFRFEVLTPGLVASATAPLVRRRFLKSGITLHRRCQLLSVADGRAVLRNLDLPSITKTLDIDAAALVLAPLPERTLVSELADFPGEVRLVGDALGPQRVPGYLMGAIHEGHAAGRGIAQATPADDVIRIAL
jgi:2,4-dienoyl-CoA reductase-like NADH-dependent reductase (Old Yellow Enzyme family)